MPGRKRQGKRRSRSHGSARRRRYEEPHGTSHSPLTWPKAFDDAGSLEWFGDFHIQTWRAYVDGTRSLLSLFLEAVEGVESTRLVKQVEAFFRGMSVEGFERGYVSDGSRNAWLNATGFEGGEPVTLSPSRGTFLAALELRDAITTLRETRRKGCRLLVFIRELDPSYAAALILTASSHSLRPIRSALHGHIAFEPKLQAVLAPRGPLTAQLSFQLPFFIPSKTKSRQADTYSEQKDIDLAFLRWAGSSDDIHFLRPAQITFVATGVGNLQYEVYFFTRGLDVDDSEFKEIDIDDSEYEEIDEEADMAVAEDFLDPIVSGRVDASPGYLIRDMRTYFLRVLEIRVREASRHMETTVWDLERGTKGYLKTYRPLSSLSQPSELQNSIDWASEALSVLGEVSALLRKTRQCWKRFNAPDGQIRLFSSLPRKQNTGDSVLHEIAEKFKDMDRDLQKLDDLSKDCKVYIDALRSKASNINSQNAVSQLQTAQETVTTSKFTIHILYPLAQAVAMSGTERPVLPFDTGPKTLVILVLGLMVLTWVLRQGYQYRVTDRMMRMVKKAGASCPRWSFWETVNLTLWRGSPDSPPTVASSATLGTLEECRVATGLTAVGSDTGAERSGDLGLQKKMEL